MLKPSKAAIGMALLPGGQHMFAHDFYKQLGEHYFTLAKNVPGILPAVKKCYAMAA